jgi:Fe-S cluster assembly protein SufD
MSTGTLQDAAERYGRALEEKLADGQGAGPAWLRERRRDAATRLQLTGFPSPKSEEWRYTPLQGVLGREFRAGTEDFAALTLDDIDELLLRDNSHCRVVFVNGRFAPRLSQLDANAAALRVGSLREALRHDDGALAAAPGLAAAPDADAFETLNAALFDDGAHLHVPAGAQWEAPIELLFVSVGLDEPAMHHPRNLLTLGEGASATVVERYAALGPSQYFTNVTTEIALAPRASLHHVRVQEESVAAHHLGRTPAATTRAFASRWAAPGRDRSIGCSSRHQAQPSRWTGFISPGTASSSTTTSTSATPCQAARAARPSRGCCTAPGARCSTAASWWKRMRRRRKRR